MKKIIILTLLVSAFSFYSCNEDEIVAPTACCETFLKVDDENLISKSTFSVGETVVFKACTLADWYAIWTGDVGHDYFGTKAGAGGNRGVGFEGDGIFEYIYTSPGTYKVVFIATNVKQAGNRKQDIREFNITITE